MSVEDGGARRKNAVGRPGKKGGKKKKKSPASAHKFGVNGAEKAVGLWRSIQILSALLSLFVTYFLDHAAIVS